MQCTLLLVVSCAAVATTAVRTTLYPPTVPPEHPEGNSIRFYYQPVVHYLVAVTSTTCFLAPLTHEERDHVHSSIGMEDLELRMLREWIGQLDETKIYHDDSHLPYEIWSWCRTNDIYLLERKLGIQTTHISPIGGLSG